MPISAIGILYGRKSGSARHPPLMAGRHGRGHFRRNDRNYLIRRLNCKGTLFAKAEGRC